VDVASLRPFLKWKEFLKYSIFNRYKTVKIFQYNFFATKCTKITTNSGPGFSVKFFSYRLADVNGFDYVVAKIIYIHSKNHLLDDIKKRKFL